MTQPLADRMRPASLDEIAGQQHLCGENGLLRRLLASNALTNMVFYGPPGVGKTTAAGIIAKKTNRKLVKLNGTTASTGDIKDIIAELDTLMAPEGILLYLDEIQYFNKKQQQSLLQYIENGKITLIASTTENPYFYVYPAILSRSTVFEFKPVSPEELVPVIDRAFDIMSKELEIDFSPGAEIVKELSLYCAGDARKCINAVELLCLAAAPAAKCGKTEITQDDVRLVAQKSAIKYDKDGDSHYDILSAFQKSIRGSDPDAAIHYMSRLIAAGDLPSLCRRLLVVAAEDIGLAYPQGIVVAKACVDSALQLGLPEARIPLAQAVILLATAPKSNSAIMAVDGALADIEAGAAGDIPAHLRDTHYSGAAKLGRGGYKYPHSFKNNYISQQYLPDEIKDKTYYEYGSNKTEQAANAYWKGVKGGEK